MRTVLWILAAGAALFFVLNLITLVPHFSFASEQVQVGQDTLKGFDTTTPVPGLDELEKLYQTKIADSKAANEKHQRNWLIVSFVVTVLTAGSTLVSSISAAKGNDEPGHKRALIIVAVLTFLATVATWGTTQLNEAKTVSAARTALLIQKRNQFYLDFEKAKTDEEKLQEVERARRDLDTV